MTSDPTTWTDLKTVLADWLNRTDLTTQIPMAIALAERKFNRVVRTPNMEDEVSASVSGATITLPADFLQLRAIYLDTDPKVTLEPMNLATLRDTYSAAATGKPQNYALQSANELVFGPAPDAAYTVVINYYKTIPALGSGQATNWLLTAHPDLYIYGSLAELYIFLRDNDGTQTCEAKYQEIVAEIARDGNRNKYGQAPMRVRSPIVV